MTAAENPMPLLLFSNIRKTLSADRVLLDIEEFSLYAGRCLLLTGANGAGKTTLLKILSGLEPADHAYVRYRGSQTPEPITGHRYRHEVIYLHQQAYLFDRSVSENVSYGLRGRGLTHNEVSERVHQALDWGGLLHLAARNARDLSNGEKQRVALARALVLTPSVLLLDEPFAGLDEESRTRAGFLIQRLKSDRVGVVVTSHELVPLAGIADQHLELRSGQLVTPRHGVRVPGNLHTPEPELSYG